MLKEGRGMREHAPQSGVSRKSEGSRDVSAKKFITTYPTLFGAFLSLLIAIPVFVMVIWFPWIGDAWVRNDRLVRSVWCTLALFALTLIRFVNSG